jgi:ADP-ribose pyrophosphatase
LISSGGAGDDNDDDASPPVEVLAQGKHLRLVSERGWEYVVRPHSTGVVVIVAVTPARRLILVEQFRVAVHRPVIELPAGLVGDTAASRGEPLATAAHRELSEETGYEAERMVELAAGPIAVGVSTEVVTFFHAQGLRRVGPGGGDETEDITVHEVALDGLRDWLAEKQRSGRAVDPKLFAGLYLIGDGSGATT